MTERCKGCGVVLQNTDPTALGYTPKPGAEYCQRCFRLSHYGDVTISMQQGIEAEKTLEKINELDAVIFWVVDLYNLEECLISRLNQRLPGKKIVMVATKRDLLPQTLSDEKLLDYLHQRLQEEGIQVDDILFSSHLNDGSTESRICVEDLRKRIEQKRDGKDIVFLGVANAGKSTLINRLLGSSELTVSRNPGTTLDLVAIGQPGYTLYDSPGVDNSHSILSFVKPKVLKSVVPIHPIKPRVFQIHENRSFAVGGLARLDVCTRNKATVVAYFSDQLQVHTGKLENANALWKKHYGVLLHPVMSKEMNMQTYTAPKMKKDEKMDVYIYGLGWFCISGKVSSIQVQVPKGIYVSFRKAMI